MFPPEPGRGIGWSDSLAFVEPNAVAGEQYDYSCPAGGITGATVWGTDVYAADSAICPAAVHAGKLSAYYGGTAAIEVEVGQIGYTGSSRNGVVSLDLSGATLSFRFR